MKTTAAKALTLGAFAFLAIFNFSLASVSAATLGPAFTCQGRLNDGIKTRSSPTGNLFFRLKQ